MSKSAKVLLVSSVLIFLSYIASIWLYRVAIALYGLDLSSAEIEKAVSCLQYGFDPCPAASQAHDLISYRLFSIDKVFLVVLSFLVAKFFFRLTISFGEELRRNRVYGLWFLSFALFISYVAVQYVSVMVKFYTWDILQRAWIDQGMGAIREGCISGASLADCGVLKNWLDMASFKTKALSFISWFLLVVVSIAFGRLVRAFLVKKNDFQKEVV